MSLDQVASSEGAAERQFACQDSRGNDSGKSAGIVTRVGGMGSPDAEKFQHRALRIQDGAAAESADFQRRHRDGDLERATKTGKMVSMLAEKKRERETVITHGTFIYGRTLTSS